jgi:hypothetical protein
MAAAVSMIDVCPGLARAPVMEQEAPPTWSRRVPASAVKPPVGRLARFLRLRCGRVGWGRSRRTADLQRCAPEGIRTPNLLIRRYRLVVDLVRWCPSRSLGATANGWVQPGLSGTVRGIRLPDWLPTPHSPGRHLPVEPDV